MVSNAAHGAALVAAAVQAAIREGAPRRTVAAVAAAAVGALAFTADRPSQPTQMHAAPATDAQSEAETPAEPAVWVAKLQAARRAQRRRKKE